MKEWVVTDCQRNKKEWESMKTEKGDREKPEINRLNVVGSWGSEEGVKDRYKKESENRQIVREIRRNGNL